MNLDVGQFLQGILLAVGALLPIVNPFGNAAMFVALTADQDDAGRAVMARRVALNGFILLVASIFVGDYVLAFFGVSIPVVQVAGGLVVASLGWRLLRADEKDARPTPSADASASSARAFYPLTLPMTVGPGSISVAITIGANFPSTVQPFLADAGSTVLGAALVCLTTFLCFRNAERMTRRLGAGGTAVFMRLSAFILLCIGVQILYNGIDALFGLSRLLAR
ncbi:MAG: MarC family protein [Burkholderiales bacterium]